MSQAEADAQAIMYLLLEMLRSIMGYSFRQEMNVSSSLRILRRWTSLSFSLRAGVQIVVQTLATKLLTTHFVSNLN